MRGDRPGGRRRRSGITCGLGTLRTTAGRDRPRRGGCGHRQRLVRGERPTGTVITQTYNVRQRGMSLYDERRYREALPLLLIAAERGFKWP